MCNTVRRFTKTCWSCHINKRCKLQYGKLPTKNVISKPWGVLYVDLIWSSSLKGKDVTQLNFMCLTMIDTGSSWFGLIELPLTEVEKIVRSVVETSEIFNKTSKQIATLVNKLRYSRYPRPRNIT